MDKSLKTDRFRSRSRLGKLILVALLLLPATSVFSQGRLQTLRNPTSGDPVPKLLLLRIIRAEDERRWDKDLSDLFRARNAHVRARAALAAGRIGNDAAVNDLTRLLEHDDESDVRATAAFALGEVESPLSADALIAVLKARRDELVGARAVEALGKIAAALPEKQQARAQELGGVILDALRFEARRRSAPDRLTILLGLTAVLRANPANAGPVVTEFLHYADPRIRADAANTLARLKLKDGNDQLRKLLTTDPDPVVRAKAAQVLGATEDKGSLDQLLDRATNDEDQRVWVSALRALATIKDQAWAVSNQEKLLGQGGCAPRLVKKKNLLFHLRDSPDCLDLITTLGRLFQGTDNETVFTFIRNWSFDFPTFRTPESEIALARISADRYLRDIGDGGGKQAIRLLEDWHSASGLAQGLAEVAALPDSAKNKTILATRAQTTLRAMLDSPRFGYSRDLAKANPENAIPDILRAYSAFKPKDLADVLREHLEKSDVIVRATAAERLGELPPDDTNTRALVAALRIALADKQLNDAALAILDSLAKQKSAKANEAIKTALDSQDYLIRRKAIALLKRNDAGDFSARIGIVQTRNTAADYERAISRIGKQIDAVVTTDKGSFTIRLLPEEAPLNVGNFVQLAKRGYFNGISFHRVVPNFVIQGGDPRGEGNGGPGYQIRCEINEASYDRGAVGMALSGKDTGGSQWFVTHSPQPHLDGGYTVFGNVVSGIETVDGIVRGDVIRKIVIRESARRAASRRL